MALADRGGSVRFLIHDRNAKFSGPFDEVFRAEGTSITLQPPPQADFRTNATVPGAARQPRRDLTRAVPPYGRGQSRLGSMQQPLFRRRSHGGRARIAQSAFDSCR
jgi:hypothetical protein